MQHGTSFSVAAAKWNGPCGTRPDRRDSRRAAVHRGHRSSRSALDGSGQWPLRIARMVILSSDISQGPPAPSGGQPLCSRLLHPSSWDIWMTGRMSAHGMRGSGWELKNPLAAARPPRRSDCRLGARSGGDDVCRLRGLFHRLPGRRSASSGLHRRRRSRGMGVLWRPPTSRCGHVCALPVLPLARHG